MSENCCCGTNKKEKVVDIEYLYLDLTPVKDAWERIKFWKVFWMN